MSRRFVTIPGLSDRRYLPRIGRIRLGHISHNVNSGKNYPEEDPYFLVPKEVAAHFGENPTELDVMLPVNDRATIFGQAYEYYGMQKRRLCQGDGRQAERWDTKTSKYLPQSCPCELLNNGCRQRAHLLVLIPKVNGTGVFQIDTSSTMSIVAINSSLQMIEDQLGFFAMIPLKLRRVPRAIYPNGMARTSYPLQLTLEANEQDMQELKKRRTEVIERTRLWVVEQPEYLNPEHDTGALVVIDSRPTAEDTALVGIEATPTTNDLAPFQPADAMPTTPALDVPPETVPSTVIEPSSVPATPHAETHAATATLPPMPQAAVARGMHMPMTDKQRFAIKKKVQRVSIPDATVETVTHGYTKKQASDLITQLDAGDFSAFEVRETTDVPLAANG